ncbi:MAG: response regulator [Chloroflexi bacterium]|nr:response regulator [Chloroflexota bacterium]MCC6892776.1 response regulator [Anaerolineae bacterium]
MSKILYVEDNPQNMRLVRKILVAAGYEVIEATNGLAGIASAERDKPDLILMDVNLPDINGLEATSRLKAMPPDVSEIPIIALTANAMHGDRENCIAAGCDGYLAKPVMKNELLNTVALFLKQVSSPKATSEVPSTPNVPLTNGTPPVATATLEPPKEEPHTPDASPSNGTSAAASEPPKQEPNGMPKPVSNPSNNNSSQAR